MKVFKNPKVRLVIIVILIIVVALIVLEKFRGKDKKDEYINFKEDKLVEAESTDTIPNFESAVKPNYTESDNGNGKTIISQDSALEVSDDTILYRNSNGDVATQSISELLDGNEPTNNNTNIDDTEELNAETGFEVHLDDGLGATVTQYIPKEISHDTDLVLRSGKDMKDRYVGVLFGHYFYSISKAKHDAYNIDKYLVIMSYNKEIRLGYDEESDTIYYLRNGRIDISAGSE